MKIKAVFFDLDGVITRTDHLHFEAWKKMLDSVDIKIDSSYMDQFKGASLKDVPSILMKDFKQIGKYSKENLQKLGEIKNKDYLELIKNLTHKDILPGIVDSIDFLKKEKILIAVCSSSAHTRKVLEQISLADRFDFIVDVVKETKVKPDPEIFLIAASHFNLKPEECLVIDDGIKGIEAAKSGGFVSLGVKRDGGNYFINKTDDLKQALQKILK